MCDEPGRDRRTEPATPRGGHVATATISAVSPNGRSVPTAAGPSSVSAIAVTLVPARMRSRTVSSIDCEISAASRSLRPSAPTAVPGARKPTCSTARATGSAGSSASNRRTDASPPTGGSSRINNGTEITGRVIAARSDGAVSCTHWNVSGSSSSRWRARTAPTWSGVNETDTPSRGRA